MSENIKMEDLEEKVPTSETEQVETESKETVETEQDPLKVELERVQKTGKTELEKAAYSLKKTAERLKELGGDPDSILGDPKPKDDSDDDAPVTIGMLRKMQQESATKTAVQLAEDISNETERELTKYHIENTIRSTGNPKEDFRLAQAIVNSSRNKQILEETSRKVPAKDHSSASSGAAKNIVTPDLTPDEILFTRPPFNMTKEQVLKARK